MLTDAAIVKESELVSVFMMAPSNSRTVLKNGITNEESCNICWKNESLGSTGGIEIPWNFLDTLNAVWPCLKEAVVEERETRSQSRCPEEGDKQCKGGRFAQVPPICQVCADRIQSVQYFKGLSNRYLEKLRKCMEEAKKEAGLCASSFSSKSKDNLAPNNSVETREAPEIPNQTLKLPWKPNFLQSMSSSSSSSPDQPVSMEAQTQQIENTIRGILNKLINNGANFDLLTSQLVATLPFLKNEEDTNPDNQLIMMVIASLIFNKAVKEPFYCPAYARLTQVISQFSSTFRKTILDICQLQFQQVCVVKSDDTDDGEDKRQRAFGIVNFIQELYNSKFKLLTSKILVSCVDFLVLPPVNQLKLECVHNFLAAEKHGEKIPFGQIIDVQLEALTDAVKRGEQVKYLPEDGWMDKFFVKLEEFSKNQQLSGRIRCLLENLVELRKNGWKKPVKSSKTAIKATEMPWGKTVLKPIPPNEEPALTLWQFERKCRGILNKVNLNNGNSFNRNFSRFLKLPFWFCGEYSKNEGQILKAGEMIFEKAVKEPIYCDGYAELVKVISQFEFRSKYPYSRNFEKIREIVVNRCIDEISKISGLDKVEGVPEQENFVKRERILAVIKFIGELYRWEVFSARNMGTCMQVLTNGAVNELKMECLYKLLMCKFMNVETKEMVCYGEFLDVQLIVFRAAGEEDDEDVEWIDGMFGSLKKFVEGSRYGGRIRCLLLNLMELRGNEWKHRSQAIASIAVSNEDIGKKNGGNGGQKKGRGRGRGKVPDGNWRN